MKQLYYLLCRIDAALWHAGWWKYQPVHAWKQRLAPRVAPSLCKKVVCQ